MKTWLRTLTLLALLAVPLVPTIASAEAQDGYRYRDIYYPGSANTALYAINARGQYVGAMKNASDGAYKAIHGRNGTTFLLDPNGTIGTAAKSWAFTTNARGEIGGVYDDIDAVSPPGERVAFMSRYRTAAGFAMETLKAAPPIIANGARVGRESPACCSTISS